MRVPVTEKIHAEKIHQVLLTLFAMVFTLALWGLVNYRASAQLPLAIWTGIGAVSAAGAILEIFMHIRTRRALKAMRSQLEKMSDQPIVGMVMIDDHWPVADLASMLNHYLSKIREEIDEQTRQRREMDLLASAMMAEKNNTEAIIKSISDAVLVLNGFGDLILANRHAEQLFGFSFEKSKGEPVDGLLNQPRIRNMITQAQGDDAQAGSDELWIENSAGEQCCFDVTVCPVFIKDKDLWAIALTLHDVTRERKLAEVKNDFVNHVTHELRTPLSSIKAYIELLLDDELQTADQRSDFYRVIHTEANRLERFIDNILNLSRIESGVMPFKSEPIDVKTELLELKPMIDVQAREKNITVQFDIPDATIINADKDLLRQAITNLLSNAVKYTLEGGSVTLAVEKSDDGKSCRITVTDTGIGIAPEEQDKVFDKFYRTSTGNQAAEGTGLGLALTKKIVEELHEGTLTLVSTMNEGSTFTITLGRQLETDSDKDDQLVEIGSQA